ncbi:polysaccharide pyruvyl transferase CsaB [Pedobacter glucosidilyticus]|nr:polysaccharide pyruvyl transferase family protein [Pedobacter glucosidilyticus]KHJ38164.1 polysaccharide pyruvyl transferase CsaB [Pedobacter glucosidilyticus]
MTIGILTFHWATNYGAVLQAYALQEYLTDQGHDVKIINYLPVKKSLRNCFKYRNPKNIFNQIKDLIKEQSFIPFRRKWLRLTQSYNTLNQLYDNPPKLDCYICGSDQIWNPYFLANGEGNLTPTYFLPFGEADVKRISYAASFGVTEYPEDLKKIVYPLIQKFNHLGVREKTGKAILEGMNLDNVNLVPDPTLLLSDTSLNKLFTLSRIKRKDIFYYILQENQSLINKTLKYAQTVLKLKVKSNKSQPFMKIEDWLSSIKYSKYVVTNSFHGVIFAILFKTPFVVIPIENKLKGMNDRISTLLGYFNLENRFLDSYDEKEFEKILNTPIDWDKVFAIKGELQENAYQFFKSSLT